MHHWKRLQFLLLTAALNSVGCDLVCECISFVQVQGCPARYQIHLKSVRGPVDVVLLNKSSVSSDPVVLPVPPSEEILHSASLALSAWQEENSKVSGQTGEFKSESSLPDATMSPNNWLLTAVPQTEWWRFANNCGLIYEFRQIPNMLQSIYTNEHITQLRWWSIGYMIVISLYKSKVTDHLKPVCS